MQKIKDFWNAGTWQKVVCIAAPVLIIGGIIYAVKKARG